LSQHYVTNLPDSLKELDAMSRTTASLIEANVRSRSNYLRGIGTLPGATLHTADGITFIETGLGVFNLVFDVDFPAAEADSRIDEVLAYFGRRGLSCAWNISPLCRPGDLADRLEERDLYHEHDLVYMAMDLTAGTAAAPAAPAVAPALPGFTVERPDSPDRWSDLVCAAFGIDDPWREPCSKVLNGAGSGDGSPYWRYVGYLDGQPVSCAALLLADGVAGIYWVGTVPGARGKGCGTAMVRRLLDDARAAGCGLAVLQATADGLGLYRALGFEALPAAEPSYLWFPASK
jgi:GNAT superfamily N-acetyltransferase